MDLSAIIVSYNEAQYISKCIESCLMQKFNGSLEIIICDDGSNDGSIELIEKYQLNYPDLIKTKIIDRDPNLTKDKVIASLRASNLVKEGLILSTGDYIVAISGDDYFIDECKFQKQFDFLKQHNNLASCYSDFYWLLPNDKILQTNNIINSRFIFWGRHYSHLSSFMFSKDVKKYLLDRICDDVGLIYSILLCGKMRVYKDVTFVYNCRSESITQSYKNIEGSVGEILLFQDIRNYKTKPGTYSRFYESILNVFDNRDLLQDKYYNKYIIESKKYNNDILNKIRDYDKLNKFHKLLFRIFLKRCLISYRMHNVIMNVFGYSD